MGAWGAGGFENDAALDFAGTIETVDDIRSAFSIETPEMPIDADKASEIVAAAECVAAMMGRPADDMPDDLLDRLKAFGTPDKALFHNARDHVSAVISRSELAELWAEADDTGGFNRAMTGLIDRLNPDLKPKKGRKRKKKPPQNPSPCAFCNEPMGAEEFSMFDISVDLGEGVPIRMGKWAHLACLNAHLHPTHLIQAWKFDPEETAEDVERLLRGEEFGD